MKCLCTFFIGVLLLSQLWQISARLLLHQKLPFFLGIAQLDVLSGSMEPAFSVGDRLIVRRGRGYAVGDVITFEEEGAFITHRIIGGSGAGFITKGDANPVEDSKAVRPEAIEGRVILVIPGGGNPFVILFLLAAFTAVAAGLERVAGNRADKGNWKGGDTDA